MSGSYLYIPPPEHHCDTPESPERAGTIWQCDECGACWRMTWFETSFWTRCTLTDWFWGHITWKQLMGKKAGQE